MRRWRALNVEAWRSLNLKGQGHRSVVNQSRFEIQSEFKWTWSILDHLTTASPTVHCSKLCSYVVFCVGARPIYSYFLPSLWLSVTLCLNNTHASLHATKPLQNRRLWQILYTSLPTNAFQEFPHQGNCSQAKLMRHECSASRIIYIHLSEWRVLSRTTRNPTDIQSSLQRRHRQWYGRHTRTASKLLEL